MGIQVLPTRLADVLHIEPTVYADARGFFKETYNQQDYAQAGITAGFVQDNLSRSAQGTLRGLHYQIEHPQGKLIQVLTGKIFDVCVDLRRDSPSFGEWLGVTMHADQHTQLFIPPGFAHGFLVLSDSADVFYKCTDLYFPQHERTLLWNDEDVGVNWPLESKPILSAKDAAGQPFQDLECYPTRSELRTTLCPGS